MNKKKLLLVAWIGAVAIGISLSLNPINFQNANSQFQIMDSDVPRAVIIDQLFNDRPSKDFENKSTEYLIAAGYQVDYYKTDEITIEFFKQLPSMNYEYIVIRSHALGEGKVDKSASIFTGEKYSKHKYIKEQFLGHVGRGIPLLYQELLNFEGNRFDNTYFVIGSKFVEEVMVGQFKDSIIILGGCETAQGSYLADSFLKRGASEVIGWTGIVDTKDNASTLVTLMEKNLLKDIELKDAVQMEMKEREGLLKEPTSILMYFSSQPGF